jgi:hypothetical protein
LSNNIEITGSLGYLRETFAEISVVHHTLSAIQETITTCETKIKDCVVAGHSTVAATEDCTDLLRTTLPESSYEITLAYGEHRWLRNQVHTTREELVVLDRPTWKEKLYAIRTAVSTYARNIEEASEKLITLHDYLRNHYSGIGLRDTEEREIELLLRITKLLLDHTDFVSLHAYILPTYPEINQ